MGMMKIKFYQAHDASLKRVASSSSSMAKLCQTPMENARKTNLPMPGTQCKTNVYVAGGLCPGMGPKIIVGVSCQNASLLNAELKLSMIWSTPKKVNVTAKNRTTWYADKVETYAKKSKILIMREVSFIF